MFALFIRHFLAAIASRLPQPGTCHWCGCRVEADEFECPSCWQDRQW